MQILRPLSKDLDELYLTLAEKLHHVTSLKKRTTEQHLIGNEVQQEILKGKDKHKPHNVTVSNNVKILDILESLLTDKMEPKEPLDVSSRQTHGENTNQNLVESTVEEDNIDSIC